MKKIAILFISLAIVIFIVLFILNNKNHPFYLDDIYYNNSSIIDVNIDEFKQLINNGASFALFIYQPLCSTSYNFDEVLTTFSKDYQISFYQMSFSDMKETDLKEYIKYCPSLVIYHNGKIIDYLDANNSKHSKYYKSVTGLEEWFFNYVLLK